jgi:biotin carboxylase
MTQPSHNPHLLLLLTSRTYRAEAFLDAAAHLGVDVTIGVEAGSIEKPGPGQILLDFSDLERGADAVQSLTASHPISAVISAEDEGAMLAAAASESLKLPHSTLDSVRAAHDKLRLRQYLENSPLLSPPYWNVPLDADPEVIADQVQYPCVVKPRFLSASRGVLRADDPAQFVEAFRRAALIVRQPEIQSQGGDLAQTILVEGYIPGQEVAVEALLHDGAMNILAIFDKPDPLIGPTFEETLYVTPSRHPKDLQRKIQEACRILVDRLGLSQGPLHAEFRLNQDGVWPIDVAPRSIGGLCSRALRFGQGATIEELILRQALGWDLKDLERESTASGVMMIPTPMAGQLMKISGLEAARQVEGIVDVIIGVQPGQRLVLLPDASRYLGFIFARRSTPESVEAALRQAHACLDFEIQPNSAKGGTIKVKEQPDRGNLGPRMEGFE